MDIHAVLVTIIPIAALEFMKKEVERKLKRIFQLVKVSSNVRQRFEVFSSMRLQQINQR